MSASDPTGASGSGRAPLTSADAEPLDLKVARGAGWMAAGRLAIRSLGVINTLIMARLLAPDDFGVVAIAVTTMQLLQGFSDIGVTQAVIRFRDAGRDDLDTLFTLSIIRGCIVALILVAVAPLAASFYGDPRLAPVFFAIAAFPLATGAINPRFFEFERALEFSKEFFVSTAAKLASVVVAVAIALAFRTYWAIILGLVASGFVRLALSYWLKPHRPRLTLASVRKVLGFSGWLTGVSFVTALNNKLDSLIVARLIGAEAAGKYYLGVQLADMPTSELATPVVRAIYPGFAALEEKPDAMRAAYLRGVEGLSAVAMPAAVGFACVATDLVSVLLGGKWAATAPIIQIIAPAAGLQMLFLSTQFYAMAQDRTRDVFFRELFYCAIRVPVFVWATLRFGLVGAAAACAAAGVFHAFLNSMLYARINGRPFWEPLWTARRSLAAVAVMAAYFVLARPALEPLASMPAPARLAADVASGALIYAGALYAFWAGEKRPDGVEQSLLRLAENWRTGR